MTARVNKDPVLDQENPSFLKFDDVIAVRKIEQNDSYS
jgi:hypothetical protein